MSNPKPPAPERESPTPSPRRENVPPRPGQPPDEPTTTVLVVMAYALVATSTPGATSVKRPI